MKVNICGFCGAKESDSNPLVFGEECRICKNCVLVAYVILFEQSRLIQMEDNEEILDYLRDIRKKDRK